MQLTWVPVGLKHVSCQLSLVCLATHYAEDPKSSNLHSYQCLKQHKNVNVSTNSLCYSFSGLKIYFFVSKHFISVSRSKSHLAVKKITFNSEDSLVVQSKKTMKIIGEGLKSFLPHTYFLVWYTIGEYGL